MGTNGYAYALLINYRKYLQIIMIPSVLRPAIASQVLKRKTIFQNQMFFVEFMIREIFQIIMSLLFSFSLLLNRTYK